MITQKQLKEILHYCPDTGVMTWLVDKPKSHIYKAGRIADCLDVHGYGQINIKGKVYKTHRLAWLYITGEFPKNQIDHINHIRHDNRLENLKEATNQSNHLNRPKQKNNSSGCVGVSLFKRTGKWRSYLTILGKNINLGYFDTFDDAKLARLEANRFYGFHENHGLGTGKSKRQS